MSEITTGKVELPLIDLSTIGRPVSDGKATALSTACTNCSNVNHDKLLKNIFASDERLKWGNSPHLSSPLELAKETKLLSSLVSKNTHFLELSEGMNSSDKNLLSLAIATDNSPLKSYMPKHIEQLKKGINNHISIENSIEESAKTLALDNFNYMNNILKDSAKASGFTSSVKIIKNTNSLLDIVFSDSKGRKFTTYSRLDANTLNPTLALDLEGFDSNKKDTDPDSCSTKMNQIIKYLNEHGIPFKYKRLKHNSYDVLRRFILKKNKSTIALEKKKIAGESALLSIAQPSTKKTVNETAIVNEKKAVKEALSDYLNETNSYNNKSKVRN